jgi:hypothetical protein
MARLPIKLHGVSEGRFIAARMQDFTCGFKPPGSMRLASNIGHRAVPMPNLSS